MFLYLKSLLACSSVLHAGIIDGGIKILKLLHKMNVLPLYLVLFSESILNSLGLTLSGT
jgi:hypothetical protein